MASPPSTPPPELPTSSKGWRFKNDRTLCEWGEQYRPGGLHPVSLGDTFCAGKYKVIRKLGSGAFSTVWLAVCERYVNLQVLCNKTADNASSVPRYVAIKITKAKATVDTTELAILEHLHSVAGDDPDFNHVTKLLDHFQHDGPNGTHLCLVFEVMSTTAASLVYELPENQPKSWLKPDRYPKWIAKRLLRHTLHGLAFLHRNGVVHGDVQPGNLLFSANNIGVIELKDLAQHEAEIAQPLIRADGKRDRWAPKSVYPQESLHKYAQLDQDLCVKVSDLGAGKLLCNSNKSCPLLTDSPSQHSTPVTRPRRHALLCHFAHQNSFSGSPSTPASTSGASDAWSSNSSPAHPCSRSCYSLLTRKNETGQMMTTCAR